MLKATTSLTIYGDGGARGNPGNAAYGFAVFDDSDVLIYSEGKRIGINTNNVAEYSAVTESLGWVINNHPKIKAIHFRLDSLLVASQMSGKFKVKHPSMKILYLKAKMLCQQLEAEVTFTQIPREQNKVADSLVNKALDFII